MASSRHRREAPTDVGTLRKGLRAVVPQVLVAFETRQLSGGRAKECEGAAGDSSSGSLIGTVQEAPRLGQPTVPVGAHLGHQRRNDVVE